MPDAGEMRHDGEAELAAQDLGNLGGSLTRAAPGTVRHGNKIGVDALKS
jgi:hypothetical protein